ncbi:UDP-N-acetylmuramate:L-alanyl-gamma-D-glutamyl-meso-diaminopimelate ligase [Immundisolibacter sp.]|uniref:UDP-N-acetylmuramate:L-alanyl-gamma-D-glutamyl- meso-diaminopimelate ligase n=1 Tax=Immundisolibacter sp. TaxID=1934948 RepID=UPI0035619166
MHLHVLGICGTFMAGLAQLAKALGHTVSGCDSGVYPPMSEQLRSAGITLTEGYDPAQLSPIPDLCVIGNALSRGNPLVEHILAEGLPYTSGPQWLGEQVLAGRHVLAVAGTHGKTTTASLLAWILEHAGLAPGFLIGGVPQNFGVSARLGHGPFVVEADEYDTAFFDKRAKFLHYRPRTCVLNNLEFDHADIYPDLAAIEWQFQQLLRCVPGNGRLVVNASDAALARVMERGCWTPITRFGPDADWQARPLSADASRFELHVAGTLIGVTQWPLAGVHNLSNALAAMAAAAELGVGPALALPALASFRNVRRRLEVVAQVGDVTLYDDFAHHPTAIAATLAALRGRVGAARIVAVVDLRSNSMRSGAHRGGLAGSLELADVALLHCAQALDWDVEEVLHALPPSSGFFTSPETLVDALLASCQPGDHILLMSNGAFGGVHATLETGVRSKFGGGS